MKTDVLIVGGSAAGLAGAITARRLNPELRICIVRKEKTVLVPCGIPYMFGTLKSPEDNIIPDAVLEKNNIDLIVDTVVSIDRDAKNVKTEGGETIEYDRMILATGSSPFVPPLPGKDLENVFSVRKDIEYLKGLKKAIDEAKDVVIIGGGFIGLEFADELSKLKNLDNVTIVELLPHCLLLACDTELCIMVEEELRNEGVKILANHKADAILGKDKVEAVKLNDGQQLKTDLVLVGIGCVANYDLARDAGLRVIEKEGVWVDDYMRTSDPHIFAAGDCTAKRCFLTGKASMLRLASIGTMEARVAAGNLYTLRRRAHCPIGVFSTVIGNLSIGSAGFTSRVAEEEGMDIIVGKASSLDKHPGKLPGAKELTVKLIFMKDSGVLIGGQVYGSDKAGYVINCIGSLIQQGLRADEIAIFQVGTHPLLTPSPIAHQIENAAEIALAEWLKK